MTLRRTILLTLALVAHLTVTAQAHSAIGFASTTFDFGTIAEEAGVVMGSFTATNDGFSDVVLHEVISTCDCTTAHFEPTTLSPGESLTFDVKYDPTGRAGRFERQLLVIVSDSDTPIELTVKGRVTPRERSVEEIYPYDMGSGVRFDTTFASFSYIEHGKSYTANIAYVNTSSEEVNIRFVTERASKHLHIDYPTTIAPHAVGDITFSYMLPEHSRYYGTLDDRLWVEVDGVRARFMVTAYGVAVDNFDLTDDILSPRAVYLKKNIKFGDVNPDNRVATQYFELRNEGGAPLYIRAIECDNEAIRCNLRRGKRIEAGESIAVGICLRRGKMQSEDDNTTARLRIVTNDPITPLQVIRITVATNCKATR